MARIRRRSGQPGYNHKTIQTRLSWHRSDKILIVLAVLIFGISCKPTKEWTQDEVKQIIEANDTKARVVSVRFVGRAVDSDYPLPRDKPVTVDVIFRCDGGPEQQNPSVNIFPDASVRIGVLVSRSKICD